MSSVLLHTCCGPCSTYAVKSLQGQGLEVTAFWYNPNVHPFREHQQRLQAMEVFAQTIGLELIAEPGYDMVRYFRAVVGHESDRCPVCYRVRLERAADTAQGMGFDAFTTTLLISPYQDHGLIRRIGEELAEDRGLVFHYEDFRPGFREGHRMSRDLGLYHQGYCGCVYSEWERYGKVKV
jgi:predicted adenine nucleotide alpha hydrolase (AANH) superfamily ATPase